MLVHSIGQASVCLSDLHLTTTLCFVIVRAITLQPEHLEFSKLVFVLFRSNSKRNRWYSSRTLVLMRVAARAVRSSRQANRASLPAKSANANKVKTKQCLMQKILKVSA